MEEFSVNCGFILTCNYLTKIIEPIHSRCAVVHFTIPDGEERDLLKDTIRSLLSILDKEGVKYDPKAVAMVAKGFFPDIRRTINELQRYSAAGQIDVGVAKALREDKVASLVTAMKAAKFNDMRKWVNDNTDIDFNQLCVKLEEHLREAVDPQSIPNIIHILNKYDYQNYFVANRQLNLVSMLTHIMMETRFK